jgi:hypothetical protein
MNFRHAATHTLKNTQSMIELRVVIAPYFVATKLEAFRGGDGGDFYAGRDLEGIVAVIDPVSITILSLAVFVQVSR